MNPMRIFQSRPALRWLVPAVVVGVVGGTSLIALTATADPALPPQTPEQLLVDVQQAKVDSFSGTVVQTSDLGLPELPGVSGGSSDTSLTSLISGTHTLQVWSAGQQKQRLAIHGTLGETDIIRNGTDVWNWSSRDNAATHTELPTGQQADRGSPSDVPSTPQEAAKKVLAAIDPTTTVDPDRTLHVAGRDAYGLVLTPKDPGSLIGQVRLAIDAETKVPLSVRVIATDGTTVFETKFSSIDFATPDDAYFTFNPPAGAKVTEEKVPSIDKSAAAKKKAEAEKSAQTARDDAEVVGTGWSRIVITKADLSKVSSSDQPKSGTDRGDSQSMQQIIAALPEVSGSWGKGRLLSSKAFSAVITDDGRIAVGAVAPEKLYQALS